MFIDKQFYYKDIFTGLLSFSLLVTEVLNASDYSDREVLVLKCQH